MKLKDVVKAMQTIESDRSITKEVVVEALKEALAKAYRKHIEIPDCLVRVDIEEKTSEIKVYHQRLVVENVEDELFVSMNHPMKKEHFISWFAVVRFNSVEIIKLYPEQNAEARIRFGRSIKIFAYCNRHGLFEVKV